MLQNRERLAREAVRKVLKNAPFLFTKEGSQRFYRSHMEAESVERLVALAREGDKEALEILKKYARGARGVLARGLRLNVPTVLHEFVWEWFIDGPPKAKSGSSPKDTGLKKVTIALCVKIVSQDYGFDEYTSPGRRDDPDVPMSACRLVAQELGLSERYVEEIWAEYKEMLLRSPARPN
jgi:hypothetical protein